MKRRFALGQVLVTHRAMEECSDGLLPCLLRHMRGDWGDLCDEDKRENDLAVRVGDLRIVSAYQLGDVRLFIITEADRSVTTLLLSSEY